jgi:hypothetical protein
MIHNNGLYLRHRYPHTILKLQVLMYHHSFLNILVVHLNIKIQGNTTVRKSPSPRPNFFYSYLRAEPLHSEKITPCSWKIDP